MQNLGSEAVLWRSWSGWLEDFRKLKRIHVVLLKLSLFHKKYESLSLDLNISLPTLHITILFFLFLSSFSSFFYTLDINDGLTPG